MDSLYISSFLFIFAAVSVALGVFLQTKSTLDEGLGRGSFNKILAIVFKFTGLGFSAFLFYFADKNLQLINMLVYVAAYLATFLLLLLARKVVLR